MNWISFPLHPDTPPDGRTLEDLFADRPVDVRDLVQQLRKTALDLGLPFGDRTMTYNSRLAQELSKWAAAEGLEAVYPPGGISRLFRRRVEYWGSGYPY